MKSLFLWLATATLLALGALSSQMPQLKADPDVVQPGPGVTLPEVMHKMEPEYTRAALNAGIQGTVLLTLIIDEAGVPRDIVVLSPIGFGLDERALECVSRWRFRPAMKDAKPVKIQAQIQVNFRLLGRSFDPKAEERRTQFNAIITRTTKSLEKPSDSDVKTMQDLAKHKFPPAEYVLGIWQLRGEGVPKDEADGLAKVQRAADENYGPALFFIGKSRMEGIVLPKDTEQGLSLIEQGAVLGSKDAQFTLGEMYERGDHVPMDVERAKKYFRLCAAAGTPECQLDLGKLLLSSPQREQRHWFEAIAWLELAQSHGLQAARGLLEPETAKLTPEQARSVERLKGQLEHRP